MANFFDRVATAAARDSAHVAIDSVGPHGVEATSYAQLVAWAGQQAARLRAVGVAPGDRVAILGANDASWIAAYLGTLRLGAVAVPLDTNYSAAQVATVLRDAGARALFVSRRLDDTARAAVATCPAPAPSPLALVDPDAVGPDDPACARADTDAAVILYTSGTTADPKGVVLTHGNLEAERSSALGVIPVGPDDVVLGVLPLFHALAQMANLLLPLASGARVVFLETVNSTTLIEALQSRGITIFACVPQFFYLIHERVMREVEARGLVGRQLVRALIAIVARLRDHAGLNLGPRVFARVHRVFGSRMRLLITGGSRFDPVIARDLYGMGLALVNGYGLTETSGAATIIRPGDRFTTSVGQPLPGVEIRIAPDEMASELGIADGSGEILIRGPVVMREYYGRPDATREALDDQGWFRTGDLGRLDADGRLYITGRKKEVIVLSSGKNLYPEEIEAHYRQSPFVKELCVLGLGSATEPAAERLHAVVVPDAEALRARGIVNVGELVRFELEGLAVQLPAHKRVLSYEIRTEPLPRTTTGKLKRPEIAKHARGPAHGSPETAAVSPADRAWSQTAERQPLVAAICERLGREAIAPGDNLELDLHLDSMERVELLTLLEARAGTRVPADVRATIFTVRDLVDAVHAAPRATQQSEPQRGDGRDEWEQLLAAGTGTELTDDLDRPTFWRAALFAVALRVGFTVARLVVRIDIDGASALPRRGPFILAPNHQAYLDGFVVARALPFAVLRQVFFVGAAEYFESALMRALARAANIVPVDPDANLVKAMQAAAAGLRRGKVLILFPEGERSIDGRLKPFRKGAAILASHLAVPIVPVALDGLYDLWPRGRPFQWRALRPWRRARLRVRFGAALDLGPVPYQVGADRVQRAVGALLETQP